MARMKGKNKSSKGNKGKKGKKQQQEAASSSSESSFSSEESTKKGKKSPRGKQRRGPNKRNAKPLHDGKFRKKLEKEDGKDIMEMSSDGNCLFRALSDQLLWDLGAKHVEIRSDICDYLQVAEKEFRFFLVLDEKEEDEDAADYESYVSAMRESGEWGGNVELMAASKLFRRNIVVHSAAASYTIEHGAGQSGGPDIELSYHDNDHYNSARDAKGSKPPKPIRVHLKQVKDAMDALESDEEKSSKDGKKDAEKVSPTKTGKDSPVKVGPAKGSPTKNGVSPKANPSKIRKRPVSGPAEAMKDKLEEASEGMKELWV